MELVLLALAGFAASVLNALAGGGTFVTIPLLILSGLDARIANMTSIVALFPGQLVIAWTAWPEAEGIPRASLRNLVLLSLFGGFIGALLLIATPSFVFSSIVPWLIAFATLVYAAEPRLASRLRAQAGVPTWIVAAATLSVAVYGGYFGGGVGFVVIALLTLAGIAPRQAGATKNVLAAAFNMTAVLVYCLSDDLDTMKTAALAAGGIAGGVAGGRIALRLSEPLLRRAVIVIGAVLTICLALRDSEAGLL